MQNSNLKIKTKAMKTTILLITILFTQCTEQQHFKENRSEFKTGDIILPDYAHSDTLQVLDGNKLNIAIDSVSSDGEIDSVLHIYCKPYQK